MKITSIEMCTWVVLALVSSLFLAGCGGGGAAAPPAPPVALTAVMPVSDSELGDWPFRLEGQGFVDGDALDVRFGTEHAVGVSRISDEVIVGTLPPLAPGDYDISLTNGNGVVRILTAAFTALQEVPLISPPTLEATPGMEPQYRFPVLASTSPSLIWELAKAPSGMSVSEVTNTPPYLALVEWSPDESQVGRQEVELVGRSASEIVHLTWTIAVHGREELAAAAITASVGGTISVDPVAHPGLEVQVELPPGAAATDATYKIFRVVRGEGASVGDIYEVTPHGLLASSFTTNGANARLTNAYARVTLPYTDELLEAAGITPGTEGDQLVVHHRAEDTGLPETLFPLDIDTVAKRVTVETPHFGSFQLAPLSITGSTTIDLDPPPRLKRVVIRGSAAFFPGDKSLIVLHGILSGFESNLDNGEWNGLIKWVTQDLRQYDNVVLVDYPWKSGVAANGAALAAMFGPGTGSERFDILAHSMGGLVARWAIEECDLSVVDHLVTLGTPHQGARFAHTKFSWFGSMLPDVTLLAKGLHPDSPTIEKLMGNAGDAAWQLDRHGTHYCFIAGQIPFYKSLAGLIGLVGDGAVLVASATADDALALDLRRETIMYNQTFQIGSAEFRSYPDHGGLYQQIATNGAGHVVHEELLGSQPNHAGGFDLNMDGDVDLDDYEILLNAVVLGYDRRNTVYTRPLNNLKRRWTIDDDDAREWMFRSDVNGDFLHNDADRAYMERWAPKRYAVRFRDRDVSIWEASPTSKYDTLPIGVGPESGDDWNSLVRFGGVTYASLLDLSMEAAAVTGLDARIVPQWQQIMSIMNEWMDVYVVGGTWTETGVTWATAPGVAAGDLRFSAHFVNTEDLLGGVSGIAQWNGGLAGAVETWLSGTNHGLRFVMPSSKSTATVWMPDRLSVQWQRLTTAAADIPSLENFGICLLLEYDR